MPPWSKLSAAPPGSDNGPGAQGPPGGASSGSVVDRTHFEALAAAFARSRMVVLGDIMLDRYVAGPADRVSPEAPVPVVRVEREWHAAGGAANVAANVLALGAQCDVIGVVGEDRAARSILRALEAMGGGCRFVRDGSRDTTVKTRILARGQQVVRIDREEVAPASAATRSALEARLEESLPGAGGLVLADYDKGVLSAPLIRRAIDAAAALDVPVIVDPKRRNFFGFAGATVFKPNRAELEAALGEPVCPDDPDWMEAARVRTGAQHLLVTLGAEGMVLSSPGGELFPSRAAAHPVFDVSGAGDTVAAVVAVSVAAGTSLVEAVELATSASAAGVARVGVATVTLEEIAAALSRS